jgi:hypothetical protein
VARDPVSAALAGLVRAAVPGVFEAVAITDVRSRYEFEQRRGWPVGLTQKPAYTRAVRAIRTDPALAPLLRNKDHGGVFVSTNVGVGHQIQSVDYFPQGIYEAAARLVLAKRLSTDLTDALLSAVDDVLSSIRALASGESDTAIVLTAFDGFGLADGSSLSTPWGSVRAASKLERATNPFGVLSPSIIMESVVPLRWEIDAPGKPGLMPLSDELTALGLGVELLPFAALLALGRGTPVRWLWRTVLSPLVGGGYNGSGATSGNEWMMLPPPELLSGQEEADLQAWAGRVASSYDEVIAVAMRRTLSAVIERGSSAEDALIDAVIAWENLFGVGSSSEMVFRVTTALAVLLAPSAQERAGLRARLAKVYALRSKVAHGGVVVPKDRLGDRRDEAIDIAIAALKSLFESYPSLIADKDRGMRLILGTTP